MKKCADTASTYEEFSKLQALPGTYIRQLTVYITDKNDNNNYLEISTSKVPYDASNLQATVEIIRDSAFAKKEVIVEFQYKTIIFVRGEIFKRWVDMNKYDMNEITKIGDIRQ